MAPSTAGATRPWAQPPARRQAPVPQPEADVVCRGPRLILSCLFPEMPEPWADLDLGAAPEPLQQRRITAGEIDQRARRARLDPIPLPMPAALRVARAGQAVTEGALRSMVAGVVAKALPPGAVVRSLSVGQGVALGEGALAVKLEAPVWRDGRQTVMALAQSADGVRQRVPVMLDLDHPEAEPQITISRGQEVTVRVVLNTVQVQQKGVAQETGAKGEAISVLPDGGAKVLRGRVIDAQTVEVRG